MSNRDTGLALIIVSVILIAVGFIPFLFPLCGIGIVLLIVGIILLAIGDQPAYGYGYYAPPPGYPYAQAPAAPAGPVTPPACPTCGSPLTWVPQYARWYCGREQQYR